ncbi:MAG: CinA family protein [Pseudomonadales bacterium]|nr:CinA family protein [Pseudomonadales bacterium]MBO6702261.1 CinA family protein [Pseudomonadales bacterium]MBO7007418.1 CinA family protein [Pseudomonadales bacterium]
MQDEISSRIAKLLTERGETVSVAESSTGGLISANLLAIPGASSYYLGGSVVYTLASRRAFLDLDREKVKELKPLTTEMVEAFAVAARLKLDAIWGIAELGATGPSGTPYGHGPGVSVIGISGPKTASILMETHSDDRQANMQAFTSRALELFEETLLLD